MYFLTSHILLNVYDPLTRNISIGEFGFLKARRQLEVSVPLTCARIIARNNDFNATIYRARFSRMPDQSVAYALPTHTT